MGTLSATTPLLAHSLAWALMYSLGQGLIIYSALAITLKAAPGLNARAKYYLSFGALTGLFAWFLNTWIGQYQKLHAATVYIT